MSATFLLRASGPGEVSSHPAARMAATFWLIAECVRSTERASSAIVIGPRTCSRMISITQFGLRSGMPFSA